MEAQDKDLDETKRKTDEYHTGETNDDNDVNFNIRLSEESDSDEVHEQQKDLYSRLKRKVQLNCQPKLRQLQQSVRLSQ